MWCIAILKDGKREPVPRLVDFSDEGSAWMAAIKYEKDNGLPAGTVRVVRSDKRF